ncbi:MAG: hypothetical protein H6Q06_1441 [Acidobacteria bacterium]|nr:hypothetical protein [Acidobacteriota bacterium]
MQWGFGGGFRDSSDIARVRELLDFPPQVAEVIPADFQIQHLIDHSHEVMQGAHRAEWGCIFRPEQTSGRGEDKSILNC